MTDQLSGGVVQPTDAQIDALRDHYKALGFPVDWYRAFARATLAAASPDGAGVPVAYCDPSNPLNHEAFAWPGTLRPATHTMPLYAAPQAQPEPTVPRLDADGFVSMEEHDRLYALKHATPQPAPSVQPPAEASEPEFFTVFALYEGGDETGWIALPGYSNETEHGVKNLVLEAARKEGYKGTVTGRLQELGWEIRPVFSTPQPPAPVVPLTDAQRKVLAFLWGSGDLNGYGFGDQPPYEKGRYWWRTHLRAAFPEVTGIEAAQKIGGKP